MSRDSSSVPSVHPALDLAAPLAYLILLLPLGLLASSSLASTAVFSPIPAATAASCVGDAAATRGELTHATTPNWSSRDVDMSCVCVGETLLFVRVETANLCCKLGRSVQYKVG